jgi:para-aminobenzoate synthetase component 1
MKPFFSKKVTPTESHLLKKNLLSIGQNFEYFAILETGLENVNEKGFDFIAGVGAKTTFNLNNQNIEVVDDFLSNFYNEWKFVQLNYNLFNSIYPNIKSRHKQLFDFNLLTIFIPETVVTLKNDELTIHGNYSLIQSAVELNNNVHFIDKNKESNFLTQYVNFSDYQIQFKKIQDYLHRGDIYEVNYCIPFIIKTDTLDLIDIYLKQKSISPAPLSTFFKFIPKFLRFTKKIINTANSIK